ncbi:hypothetical protein A2482_00020 [Candidatus Falkowbacteria bacterium RIFOXYC2_FULL_48_21]|uniref:Uncharacterized protein n=1 Tax=Candidatus Falkowbacteria bacterium RIFOXYC2_FULL_48_21 TaxID=1798005 RepID=A0A1F5T5G1_9BACT|nr:MAG: hypothetical protein A2482_00020 [Candidatus Falkowbacteria bacterium RIFOXYC2_FULL_48_21]
MAGLPGTRRRRGAAILLNDHIFKTAGEATPLIIILIIGIIGIEVQSLIIWIPIAIGNAAGARPPRL